MDVMQAYNLHERIGLTLAGCQKIVTPEWVKFVSNGDLGSCITYSDIQSDALDEKIKTEVEYFNQLKLNFTWHAYSTDEPSTLGDRLITHGFEAENSASLMVLDLRPENVTYGVTDMCIEVSDKEGIKDALAVQKKVWGRECQVQASHLIRLKEECPEQIHIYVVYQDEKPVSSAWLMCQPESPFGSIWAGSTLKEYRSRGFYSALLAKRIQDAKTKGLKYLSIHASNMSRPIVEKYGFKMIAQTTQYRYEMV